MNCRCYTDIHALVLIQGIASGHTLSLTGKDQETISCPKCKHGMLKCLEWRSGGNAAIAGNVLVEKEF